MFYTKSDLAGMGEKASFGLFSNETPLIDSVVKMASSKDLNQEQIKRVCHAANTKTMLQIYKSASDNTKEFDVVDPADVIKRLGMPIKEASLEKVAADYSVPLRSHIIKMASKNSAPRRTEMHIRQDLIGMKKVASDHRLKAEELRAQTKMSFYKHAGALQDLADALLGASEKGYSTDEMLDAALKTGDDPAIVKNAVEQALELAKKKKPGIFSRAWSSIKSFFKGASAANAVVDSEYISSKLKELSNGSTKEILNTENPFCVALKNAFDTRNELRGLDAGTRTVEESAAAAVEKVKNLETEMKESKK